ncbi:peptide chain release factor N(5)-glutamine methyltransferase [Vagococcus coleopterorum]|uniref:Release factor glutamine methyltransferase n=1 Tax=Vagococcus coleopterorum TaxID=2714946 RepID=A0A6G8AMU9_9ENTE|nr:peptide chain release factor N(5)-glutamine methyltransferase [Vagococcus coleopterorum]QIL46289.1 peptide chain release factor N(5)-glutamine methyltransferase [Vagococcus coleopterorum]
MQDNLYVEVLKRASSFLEEQGLEGYLAEYLLCERQGWNKTDLVTRLRTEMPENISAQFELDLAKVLEGQPAQYVIGSCEFYGRRFKVNSNTLIPRPETEELVQGCLAGNDKEKNLKVLDIGTGTGAIAISLKQEAPDWDVTAVDLSPDALAVASLNAEELQADVRFLESDLTQAVKGEVFDIVISNPPYISADEWDLMDESVREYEPKMALFAENKGLALYEQLAQELKTISHEQTTVYLEIGFNQGRAVQEIFQNALPNRLVEIKQDVFGQDRMVFIQ